MTQETERNERERHDMGGLLAWTWAAGAGAGILAGALTQSWGVGATVGGLAVYAPVVYGAACKWLDNLAGRKFVQALAELDRKRLDLAHERERLALEHQKVVRIYPDPNGRLPILQDGDGTMLDLNSQLRFTMREILQEDPMRELVDSRIRALVAAHGWPTPAAAAAMMPEQPAAALAASGGSLGDLLTRYNHKPRLHSILIGETVDPGTGQAAPLLLDLPKSVHVLVTGASGLGKSTLEEAIALQLATMDGVELAAIDYGSGTFDGLTDYARWPLADTPALAVALLRELIALCNRRKVDFAKAGRIRSLEQYNATTGSNLPFVAVMIDETSALLDQPGTKGPLVELARMGRKYGCGLLLGGTDFKADTLPSEARGNCQARLAFWLEQGLSQSLLGSPAANRIRGDVGQIVVKRPGVAGTVEGRTPQVIEGDYRILANRPPAQHVDLAPADLDQGTNGAPSDTDDDPTWPDDERIKRLHDAGMSDTGIARRVYGHENMFYINKVRRHLAGPVVVGGDEDQEPHTNTIGQPGHTNTNNRAPDWCEYCDGAGPYTTCRACGVAVCTSCAAGGLCPDCQGGE